MPGALLLCARPPIGDAHRRTLSFWERRWLCYNGCHAARFACGCSFRRIMFSFKHMAALPLFALFLAVPIVLLCFPPTSMGQRLPLLSSVVSNVKGPRTLVVHDTCRNVLWAVGSGRLWTSADSGRSFAKHPSGNIQHPPLATMPRYGSTILTFRGEHLAVSPSSTSMVQPSATLPARSSSMLSNSVRNSSLRRPTSLTVCTSSFWTLEPIGPSPSF